MKKSAGRMNALFFDNRFVQGLPGDKEEKNFRRQVLGACYSRVMPTPVPFPRLLAFSREAARLIGLDEADCRSEPFTRIFTGNALLPGMDPFAMCYGGHQFGNWAGQLGDGRAINLGEVKTHQGEHWMLQLKGAGPTPYSRTADGLAVLRSSIREFLCSEAMHHLGVPTTRALSLTLTGRPVERDMFYDGHPREEPGAVVCRMSPSFTRFGNFQIHAARNETGLLKTLMDHTIAHDFPGLAGRPGPDLYLAWFRQVCGLTMDLMVHWMRVGFVHGVMNTDNMSILGLTLDYGPYGWVENYDPEWTPNTTDAAGRRYRFENQPGIALWNLAQLANAILPITGQIHGLETILNQAAEAYSQNWLAMMAGKLGFSTFDPATDPAIITATLQLLSRIETDYTLFFRGLSQFDPAAAQNSLPDFLLQALYQPDRMDPAYPDHARRWLNIYARRLQKDDLDPEVRRDRMNRVNPRYVLRNYMAQQAIDKAEQEDFSMVWEMAEVLRRPYEDQPGKEHLSQKRPEWARHRPGCAMLSCSS